MESTVELESGAKLTAMIRVRCVPELKDRLDSYAKRTIGDPSDHVRKAIEVYLAERDPQPELETA